MLTPSDRVRFSRHLSLAEIGAAGQEKLRAARVLIIGAGGLGSPAALYLAASGVGTLGLVDSDRVDLSNLQRQVLYDAASVGEPKVAMAARRIRALDPQIEVVAHDVELRAANVLEIVRGYDVVLDGTDRFGTRYLSNDACVILRKPLVSAAIHRFEGQAMTYVPGRAPCYRCLFPEPPAEGLVPNCADAGVLGVLPGVLGTIQATEAIKLITGAGEPLLGRLLTYDALSMRFGELRFARRTDCAVCADVPTITSPQDLAPPGDSDASVPVQRLTPQKVLELVQTSAGSVVIVDVREPHEFAVASLPAARNIPLAQLAQRLGEIPASARPVFVCRSGGRSLRAAEVAAQAGVANVADLEGGLLAWARDVDPAFEVAPV